jgi:cobalt-zinc-cadmium efflux system outer membrane protein
LAEEVQAAFYTLRSSQALVAEWETTAAIDATAADLAARQQATGNINELALLNQQAAYAQSRLELVRAKAEVQTEREKLNRLLGLSGPDIGWKTADTTLTLPERDPSLDDLETRAIKQRLDLAASYHEVQTFALALHLKENTRWVPGLTLGVDTERQTDSQIITGPFVSVELPVFDQGQPAIAKLTALYRQAERRYEGKAIDIRSEVRDACASLVTARETAAFYQNELLPQRRQIVQQTLLQYNAMQVSGYVLLAARENEQVAQRGYIEAQRDYWVARVRLDRAVGGKIADAPGKPASLAQANAATPAHL